MATGNSPIIGNAQRFPHVIAQTIKGRPSMLSDESTDTVDKVARTLVKFGHRADLLSVCEESGLDMARRAIIRQACSANFH